MTTKTPTPPKSIEAKLSSGINVDIKPANGDDPRKFSGVATSGLPFSRWGWNTVIDLDNIQHKPKVAILHEHMQPAGSGTLSVDPDKGLLVTGTFLSNEWGQFIAQASDEGFPWEMSVHVAVGRSEELAAGATTTVNGKEVSGPLSIWRDCVVREVSFTAVGVDPNTSASALSGLLPQPSEEHVPMTPEEQQEMDALKAQVATLEQEKADLKTANEKLEAEKADAEKAAQEAEVDAELSAAGFHRNEDGKGFKGVSAATYGVLLSAKPEDAKAMIADLAPSGHAKPAVPGGLLSDSTLKDKQPGATLSGLAADAAARKNNGANYV
ncbi:hypothetical protein [Vitreoscilla massiliensis]|uniref:hypothetical protein n=1 Tax=Vitreoscilla massiliensis TaxID=1689272 RepID=UPI00071D9F87|nr:hypothetical protein [Vitreoscilla massiliensis]